MIVLNIFLIICCLTCLVLFYQEQQTKKKKKSNRKLLFARVIVLPIEGDELSKGSLIIPAESENTPRFGKVIDIGTEIKHCQVGDVIFWRRDGGDELLIDNVLHLIMNEADVLGIT